MYQRNTSLWLARFSLLLWKPDLSSRLLFNSTIAVHLTNDSSSNHLDQECVPLIGLRWSIVQSKCCLIASNTSTHPLTVGWPKNRQRHCSSTEPIVLHPANLCQNAAQIIAYSRRQVARKNNVFIYPFPHACALGSVKAKVSVRRLRIKIKCRGVTKSDAKHAYKR